MKKINQLYITLLLKIHNRLYRKISYLSRKLNNDIHPKHEIIKYYQYFLDNIDENSTILDIGCGRGTLTNNLAKKAQKVMGIDISKNYIMIAKNRYKKNNLKFINVDATKYEFKEKVDYIILSNVIEHIDDRIEFLNKIKNYGNIILIRVPMINRSWLALYKKQLGCEYRLDPSHHIEYTFQIFKKEMDLAGIEILEYSIQFGEIWAKLKSLK